MIRETVTFNHMFNKCVSIKMGNKMWETFYPWCCCIKNVACYLIILILVLLHLTHWGRVMHICISKLAIIAWTAPSHYLNQCWTIVNWTLGNKLQWNLNRNSYIFIQENVFENVVWKIAAIFSQPWCVNSVPPGRSDLILQIDTMSTSSEIVLRSMPLILVDIMSTLV